MYCFPKRYFIPISTKFGPLSTRAASKIIRVNTSLLVLWMSFACSSIFSQTSLAETAFHSSFSCQNSRNRATISSASALPRVFCNVYLGNFTSFGVKSTFTGISSSLNLSISFNFFLFFCNIAINILIIYLKMSISKNC